MNAEGGTPLPGEPEPGEVYESIGDAPVDDPPPDQGDAGDEGLEGGDAET